MSKQTGTLFMSTLLSALIVVFGGVALVTIISLLGGIEIITGIPPIVDSFLFFFAFIVINRLLFVRLSKMTARSGRILKILNENDGWMSREEIAAALGRTNLLDSDYDMLSSLVQQHKIEERTEKVPGSLAINHSYRSFKTA